MDGRPPHITVVGIAAQQIGYGARAVDHAVVAVHGVVLKRELDSGKRDATHVTQSGQVAIIGGGIDRPIGQVPVQSKETS